MVRTLENVKILDFTRLLPGPFGTQILGDLGADVVKVEDFQAGDYARHLPPVNHSVGGFFTALNRNKRSLKLDLKNPGALEVVHYLLTEGGFDVMVEGFRPGVAERLGIDYEALSQINPRIIYGSLPGFGSCCSFEGFAAHDMNLLGLSGILSITGNNQAGPTIPGIQIDDMASGMYLVMGILAALFHRERTGRGQRVEVSMADAALALNATNLVISDMEKKAPGFREHMLNGRFISYQIYKTKDERYLTVGAVEQKFWVNACRTMDLPELVDAQFSEAVDGEPHFEKIKARVAEKTLAEWTELFADVDACVEPVLNTTEALNHPHFTERGMVTRVNHPTEGDVVSIGLPIRLSETPVDYRCHAPAHGEQSREILLESGLSEEKVSALFEKQVTA